MKIKMFLIILVVAICAYGGIRGCNRTDNGIHTIPGSENVVLIEGSCVTINWNSSETEVEAALERWWQLRDHSVPCNGKVKLVRGWAILVDWNASPREVELALDRWHKLRKEV